MVEDGCWVMGEGREGRGRTADRTRTAQRCTRDARRRRTTPPRPRLRLRRPHGDPQAAAVLSGPRWAWLSILVHGQNQAKASIWSGLGLVAGLGELFVAERKKRKHTKMCD